MVPATKYTTLVVSDASIVLSETIVTSILSLLRSTYSLKLHQHIDNYLTAKFALSID